LKTAISRETKLSTYRIKSNKKKLLEGRGFRGVRFSSFYQTEEPMQSFERYIERGFTKDFQNAGHNGIRGFLGSHTAGLKALLFFVPKVLGVYMQVLSVVAQVQIRCFGHGRRP
jgi:hypothetical protein